MINRDDLLSLITTEDVFQIMRDLGSQEPIADKQGNYYFTTVCHGGLKHKLLFYTSSKMFMCLTSCGSLSLYDVVSGALSVDFSESFKYVANFKGVKLGERSIGFVKQKEKNEDLDFLGLHLYKPQKRTMELPKFNEQVLNVFDPLYPLDWFEEGISEQSAEVFDIRFYRNQNKAIIPHRDINGGLVGVRARSYNRWDVENGRKYMPITVQGLTYRYPMGFNLFGISHNANNIKKHKKVILFESEKSVLLYESMYGRDGNIALALCSMNMSIYQRDLILGLDVDEVTFALDKQYTLECLETRKGKDWIGFVAYVKKLKKLSSMFINYCNVSVILCFDERLDYKDAPIDRGKDIFEEMMSERYLIEDIDEFDNLIETDE